MRHINELKVVILAFAIMIAIQLPASSTALPIQDDEIASVKRTPQSLYLTSRGAYELLTARPDVLFIDVRDPVEIALVGHPEQIDAIVPVMVHSKEFDDTLGEYKLVDNALFLKNMSTFLAAQGFSKHDKIIVTCGSGWRSAKAARTLSAAGYSNVWHIVDGYPGEEKPGVNVENAWQLAGLPWTTTADVWGSAWRRAMENRFAPQL